VVLKVSGFGAEPDGTNFLLSTVGRVRVEIQYVLDCRVQYQSFRMAISLYPWQTRLWRVGKSFNRSLGPLPLASARWTSSLTQSPLSDIDVSRRPALCSIFLGGVSHYRAFGFSPLS